MLSTSSNTAGHRTDEQIEKILDDRFLAYWFYTLAFAIVMLVEWVSYLRQSPRMPWFYTACALFFTGLAALQFHQTRKQQRSLKLSREAERLLAQQLDTLKRQGAWVLHDIPGDNFNLDHVVICPKGIFVVEAKTLGDAPPKAKVVFDGEKLTAAGQELEQDSMLQTGAHVAWLGRLLKDSTGAELPVRGVVTMPGLAAEITDYAHNSQLCVLKPDALPEWLSQEPTRLKEFEVAMAGYHLEEYARAS